MYDDNRNTADQKDIIFKQNIYEEFIKVFKNQLLFVDLVENQELSEDFILEFQDELNWYWLIKCDKVSIELYNELKATN